MATICRPTTIADQERLAAFLIRVFAADPKASFVSPAMLRWKYWEPREDFPGSRSHVTERDGQIIAHVGIWPVIARSGTTIERGFHAIDWAADPKARGAGATLFARLIESYDFVYGVGGTEMARTILPRIGFRSMGEALTWARPLRPWEQMLKHGRRDLRLPLRLARNIWWSRMPAMTVPRGWAAVEPSAGRVGELGALAGGRDQAFFAYLQKCPLARCLTFHIVNGGRAAGFFVLFVLGEQARVAGVWLEDPSAENWRIAFQLAQHAALQHTKTSELIARCATGASASGARQAGMRLRQREPVMLFRKDRTDAPLPLQCQLCDNDSISRSEGQGDFLT